MFLFRCKKYSFGGWRVISFSLSQIKTENPVWSDILFVYEVHAPLVVCEYFHCCCENGRVSSIPVGGGNAFYTFPANRKYKSRRRKSNFRFESCILNLESCKSIFKPHFRLTLFVSFSGFSFCFCWIVLLDQPKFRVFAVSLTYQLEAHQPLRSTAKMASQFNGNYHLLHPFKKNTNLLKYQDMHKTTS